MKKHRKQPIMSRDIRKQMPLIDYAILTAMNELTAELLHNASTLDLLLSSGLFRNGEDLHHHFVQFGRK